MKKLRSIFVLATTYPGGQNSFAGRQPLTASKTTPRPTSAPPARSPWLGENGRSPNPSTRPTVLTAGRVERLHQRGWGEVARGRLPRPAFQPSLRWSTAIAEVVLRPPHRQPQSQQSFACPVHRQTPCRHVTCTAQAAASQRRWPPCMLTPSFRRRRRAAPPPGVFFRPLSASPVRQCRWHGLHLPLHAHIASAIVGERQGHNHPALTLVPPPHLLPPPPPTPSPAMLVSRFRARGEAFPAHGRIVSAARRLGPAGRPLFRRIPRERNGCPQKQNKL